jgi:hypothetical protein
MLSTTILVSFFFGSILIPENVYKVNAKRVSVLTVENSKNSFEWIPSTSFLSTLRDRWGESTNERSNIKCLSFHKSSNMCDLYSSHINEKCCRANIIFPPLLLKTQNIFITSRNKELHYVFSLWHNRFFLQYRFCNLLLHKLI